MGRWILQLIEESRRRFFFHNTARTVNQFVIFPAVIGRRLLLECSLCQEWRAESRASKRKFPLDPKPIDTMVLSHAAIDPSGNLFNPVKNGFSGPMHAPTAMVVN